MQRIPHTNTHISRVASTCTGGPFREHTIGTAVTTLIPSLHAYAESDLLTVVAHGAKLPLGAPLAAVASCLMNPDGFLYLIAGHD
jgi:hypothetical protein